MSAHRMTLPFRVSRSLLAAAWSLTVGGLAVLSEPYFKLASKADWEAALADGRISPVSVSYDALNALYGTAYPGFVQVTPTLYALDNDGSKGLGDGLLMTWGDPEVLDTAAPQVASWQFAYGTDPNLVGATLSITVTPPQGILAVSLTLNSVPGGWVTWGWPVGGVGGLVPGVPTQITIDPVTFATVPFAAPVVAGYLPQFTTTIQADELAVGILGWNAFPAVPVGGGVNQPVWNYWSNLQVIPEPQSAAVWMGGALLGAALVRRLRRG